MPRFGQRLTSSTPSRVIASLVLISVFGGLAVSQASAAFRADALPGFESDVVRLHIDRAAPMFDATSMVPGKTVSSRIRVASIEDAPEALRLYGSTEGVRFARLLHLDVDLDGSTLYVGTLADFPDAYATGISLPTPGREASENTYRFEITLTRDGRRLPPLGTQQTFTWEGRSI
jgi:hypothetical protein